MQENAVSSFPSVPVVDLPRRRAWLVKSVVAGANLVMALTSLSFVNTSVWQRIGRRVLMLAGICIGQLSMVLTHVATFGATGYLRGESSFSASFAVPHEKRFQGLVHAHFNRRRSPRVVCS